MRYILMLLVCLALVGCRSEAEKTQAAADQAEANIGRLAHEAVVDARPARLKIVSKEVDLGGLYSAIILQDTKTGREYLVTKSYRASSFVVPLEKEE
jgi:hypothetical protein